ncbi:hypothetical protein GQ54DRAFT_310966 [Martensiomyces pterosporus]|nr:hypothetical protein GQ54DRAFT_310966 [Martensiomyces pterosporus]
MHSPNAALLLLVCFSCIASSALLHGEELSESGIEANPVAPEIAADDPPASRVDGAHSMLGALPQRVTTQPEHPDQQPHQFMPLMLGAPMGRFHPAQLPQRLRQRDTKNKSHPDHSEGASAEINGSVDRPNPGDAAAESEKAESKGLSRRFYPYGGGYYYPYAGMYGYSGYPYLGGYYGGGLDLELGLGLGLRL